MSGKNKKLISFRLSKETTEALEDFSRDSKLTRTLIVELAIIEYVKKHRK